MSTLLRQTAEQVEERIRIDALARAFGDRTFAALLLVFALPNLLPLPPGSSTLLGLPLVLISAQLALGRRELWLPQAVGSRSIRRTELKRVVHHGVPPLRRTERLLAPRLPMLVNDRLIGLACTVLAVVLALPIPLGNMLPAFAICAFALGLLQRDGLAVMVGWAATIASIVLVTLVSGTIFYALKLAFGTAAALIGG
ncbi:exopolysaccharide biosynthesis protein [Enterovirga sp. CN4-39]|uniref:exopolysaccharide biosynthesis protein n=1 Tax=Enterovirga sp. CN4-39 TaxID=3400910 RepID=UPI003C096291